LRKTPSVGCSGCEKLSPLPVILPLILPPELPAAAIKLAVEKLLALSRIDSRFQAKAVTEKCDCASNDKSSENAVAVGINGIEITCNAE
jgi:hypothetical protein